MDLSTFYAKPGTSHQAEDDFISDDDDEPSQIMDNNSDYQPESSSEEEMIEGGFELNLEMSSEEDDFEDIELVSEGQWSAVSSKQHTFTFISGEELCLTASSSAADGQIWPVDIYLQFLTIDIIDMIVRETNRYAEQSIAATVVTRKSRLNDWNATTREEIKKFIGLVIYMGLVPLPELSLYWSKSLLYHNKLVSDHAEGPFSINFKNDSFL